MGKKGVLLDNGKQARSSMALYWNNAASKNNNKDKKEKQEAPEQDMETRAGSNLDKWKQHKQKLINKLYEKPEKKEKVDPEAQKERQKKQEEQIQRQLLQKQLNKNKPINIPGFKNANQLKSKLYFEQVKKPDNTTNVLAPRAPGEELTHQEIVQILREKKAKKEMARAHQEKVENTLRQKQQSFDLLMDEFPPQKKQNPPEPVQQPIQKVPQAPQTFFKSELLQKIQRGQHVFKKAVQNSAANQQINMNQQAAQKQVKTQPSFVPKFIPRALWQK